MRHLMLPPRLSRLGYPYKVGSTNYYYNDNFSVLDPAPLADPHIADRVGSVDVVDTVTGMSVDADGLYFPNLNHLDGLRAFASVPRAAGLAVYSKTKIGYNGISFFRSGLLAAGFSRADLSTESYMGYRHVSSTGLNISFYSNNVENYIIERTLAVETEYEFLHIILSAGSRSYLRGGVYPNWTLQFGEGAGVESNLYYHFEYNHPTGTGNTGHNMHCRHWRVRKPDTALWTSDTLLSTVHSVAGGYTGSMTNWRDGTLVKITTLPTAGTREFIIRKIDATNKAAIEINANPTNNCRWLEYRNSATPTVMMQTTIVAGDVVGLFLNRDYNTTRQWIGTRNLGLVSAPNGAALSPQGTGVEVIATDNGSYAYFLTEPYEPFATAPQNVLNWITNIQQGV